MMFFNSNDQIIFSLNPMTNILRLKVNSTNVLGYGLFSLEFFIALLLGLNFFSAAHAQERKDYPDKPIKMVVPYVAGGAADITARLLAQSLSQSMNQAVIVDNKPGANGNIGAEYVAKAAPDGYTVLLTASGPLVVNPVLYKKSPFDPVKDFSPISLVISYQYAVVVPTQSPIKNLLELVAEAKRNPKSISYGSTGIGGGGHLAGELLALQAKVEMTHVPYKGAAPALADLLGGQLSFTFEPLVTATPLIKAGKLRAFAVSSAKRSKALANLPTLAELGYEGYDISQFQGLLAPSGTDSAVINKLNLEVLKALKLPQVIKRLVDDGGNEIVGSSPQEFTHQIQSDLKLYGKLINDAKIQAE
jgi:tripartite-type tricarboxylate transporter receptor subunit TctC